MTPTSITRALPSRLLAAGVLGAALFGAGNASADTITLVPGAPGTLSAEFVRPVDGLFVDYFDFSPVSFDGTVSVTLASVSGPVSFFAATLNGNDFSFLPESGSVDFSFQAQVTSDQPLALTVFGAVLDADGNPGGIGSYSADITAAVPEAQTWALLLAGLGVTAWIARGRRRSGMSATTLQPVLG